MTANILQFGGETPLLERRHQPRRPALRIGARPEGRTLRIVDLSRRGMSIQTDHPYAVGGSYIFELFGEGRTLLVEGEVRWCREIASGSPENGCPVPVFRAGVAFVGVRAREIRGFSPPATGLPPTVLEHEEEEKKITSDRIARLRRATSPNEAAEFLLDLLSLEFDRLVLFRVRSDEARAWAARGSTLIPMRLRSLRLGLDQASVFLHLKEGGSFFYGSLPAMFPHLQLIRCWRGGLDWECALFPIRINDRLVSVLYADCGGAALTPTHLGKLHQATEVFASCLSNQILRQKAAVSGASREDRASAQKSST